MREEALVAQEARIHANIYFDTAIVAAMLSRPSPGWESRERKKEKGHGRAVGAS